LETTFLDSRRRIWMVNGDEETIARVRRISGVDLRSIESGARPLPTDDPDQTARALWAVVKPLAEIEGIGPDEFYQVIADPDVRAAAIAAVNVALADHAPEELRSELLHEGRGCIAQGEVSDDPPPRSPFRAAGHS
jgi:hypothetical protein